MISCSSSFDFLPLEEPPRYSIVQGSFFRIRDPNTTLYPSRCYAIPDVPAIRTSFGGNNITNTHPIRFIGVNSASFDENDPPTVLRRGSTEVVCCIWCSCRCATMKLHRGDVLRLLWKVLRQGEMTRSYVD